ncbi:MAG: HYR domain-containing protein, partial [Bacteroidota bacterium]
MKNQYATFFRKTTATFVALIALFLISTSSNVNAQTVLISPTGDGGFETGTTFAANGWTTALPGTARQWQVGTAAGASAGTRAAYLGSTSNYNGVAAYAIGHFYRDVIIPPGATNVFLNYYYRQTIIDGSWDYFYIFTTTPAYTPVSGTTPGAGYTQQFVNTSTTYAAWTSMPQINLTALAGTTVRLVFTYYSDGVTPHFNPAVDRISLVYTPAAACSGTPATPTATISASTGCASTNFTLSATGATTGTGITYSWESSPTGGAPWTPTGGTTLSYVTSTATTMYYRLITTCNVGGSSTSTSVSYTPVVCCSHRLECYDSFGDGWNGGSVNLYVGGNLVGNYTVASGYGPTTVNFNAPGGGAIQVTMAAAGSYPTEMYINVYDGMNNPLVTNYYINNGTWNGTAFCPSPCTGIPAPGNTLSSVVGACLGVPFTLSLQNPTAGSGVTYQWQSSPDGTSWSPIGGANSSTYTGTQVSATYYNCIVTCSGNNGTSTSLFLPMSLPNDCYCIPVGSASYYLSNVNTTGGVTNFNNSTGGSVGGYGDYHLTQSCSVLQGGTITISLTPSITTDYFYIWLDLNQDGDFIDAGEQIGYSGGYFASYSLAYTVPLIQAAGSYRMRVANSYIGTVVPCGPSSYGEYEDYTLTVIALTNCAGTPATPVASISSASGCNGTNFNLNATGIETGSGISYQWQTSADGLTGWVSTGGTTVPYTTSSATTAYYQLVTTCSLSGLTSTSNVVSYTALPCTNINVPISGFNEVACGLNANIYDDGGPGGNYSNYDNGYTVLNNAGVGTITLTGTYSGIETCCDYIQIYSGVGTGGTLLATYGAAGSGTITPIVSGLGQALTIRFYSDLSGVGAGFALMSTFSGACTFGPPSITSFTPSTGCPNGTLVTITGTDFFGATAVNFGGVPAASYTVVDGTTITATPALGATGTIEVITPGGTVTSAGTFTFYAYPVITVQPEAPAAGFCGGVSTANISVTATGATTYQWYRNGVLLTNTAPYSDVTTNTITVTNPTVAENGVLLTCVIGNGTPCSVTTNAVSIIVGVAPADPTSVTATPNSICLGATSNLNAISAGNNINWWSAAVGGTLLGNSASGVNLPVTPIVTTTYYAEANTGSTGSQTFNYSGSIANWTVPAGITSVTITAIGAGGGITTGYTPLAGKGAKMVGTFAVTPGATLKILVGAKGADGTTTSGGGGGGGTFVTDLSNTPLIVAGGGGGIAVSTSVYTPIGADAVITTSGVSGNSASGGSPANYGIGGVGGNGATNTATGACGGNGGGLLTNGTANASCCPNTYGYAFVNGGAGGTVCTSTGNGGFGGGGGGGNTASGGGGGYSGGGASWNNPTNGGGGGSYNNGTAQTNTAGFNAGNGSVIISWNNAGCPSVNRVPVTVTVGTYPVITAQPATPSPICGTGTRTFSVTATGTSLYQWYRNGVLLPEAAPYSGTTTNTLTLTDPSVGENGVSITCVLGFAPCTATTNPVILNIAGGSGPPPPSPVTATPNSICAGATSNLNAISAGNQINWWTSATGGSLIGSTPSGINFPVTPITTTTYYAESNTGAAGTQTFNYTGGLQTWIVPAGVVSIDVDVQGAKGGDGISTGGLGGRIQATYPVTPGQTLNIYVGGAGSGATAGYNGGGAGNASYGKGGGGASDIRIGGTALANRVFVAGGGGGAGDNCATTQEWGGHGGGLIGQGGFQCNTEGTYATGGSQVAGGTGGSAAGTLGVGGAGSATYGGGGGGGYYGGGGASYGGGGGGSNYSNASATAVINTRGYRSGNGIISITYNAPGCPSATRESVVVTVGTIPTITTQPLSPLPICGTGIRTLEVLATGTSTYQWYRNGVILTNTAPYSGVTTNILTITDPAIGENGVSLTCVLGISPCTITTNAVLLSVVGAGGTPLPNPVTATPSSLCFGATANLNAVSAGNQINWYTAATAGTLLGTTASAVNFPVTPLVTTTYYAESYSGTSGSQTFNYSGSIVNFTIPGGVTSINITAKGASGGYQSSGTAGKGASMTGTFAVTPGQSLSILVGQSPGLTTLYPAGGGGTYVGLGASYATATPLIVAGGGGAAYSGYTGTDAPITTSGTGTTPGTGGNGAAAGSCTGGGGGFYTSGGTDLLYGYTGGSGFHQGGAGGIPNATYGGASYQVGGFGGGAPADYWGSCYSYAGNGGGYSGGSANGTGAVYSGNAGGSFNGGTAQVNIAGNNNGNGQVVISWFSPGCPSATRVPVTVTLSSPVAADAITSNSPQCAGTAITFTKGTCPTGSTCYWVSSANGTEVSNSSPTYTSATTAGTYTVFVRPYNGICWGPAVSLTGIITEAPTTVTVTPASAALCIGGVQSLVASGGNINVPILSENFNGPTNTWTKINNTTGGTTPANTAWTLQPNGYFDPVYPAMIFHSNDNSQFYISNSNAGGAGNNTATILQSPSFSTVGYSAVSLKFWHHYYKTIANADAGYVEASINGTTWTTLTSYTTSQGTFDGFVSPTVALTAPFINQPIVYVRFRNITTGQQWWWAVDNVSVIGVTGAPITWTPTSTLYTNVGATTPYVGGTAATTVYAKPTANTTYSATATSGCTTVGTSAITVTELPGAITSNSPQCSGAGITFTKGSCVSGTCYWVSSALGTETTNSAPTYTTSATPGTYTVWVRNYNGVCWTDAVSATGTVFPVVSTPGAITSNSTQCAGTGVTFTKGSCTSGTCYWVSSATGTETTNSAPTYTTPSTMGVYTVWVRAYDGNCWSSAVTASGTVLESPSALTVTPTSSSFCAGAIQQIDASGGTITPVNNTIFTETFNAPTNGWTKINNSTGGIPSAAAWTLTPSSGPWQSNDNSQFYLSNSDAQGSGGNTSTILQSPVFNTIGYTTASLRFYHYYSRSALSAKVDYSLDGTSWINMKTYIIGVGAMNGFAQDNIAFPAGALNQPTVYIRFKYDDSWGYYWAIDNVTVTGDQNSTPITWTPATNLYTNAGATTAYIAGSPAATVYAKPVSNITYTATATAGTGCTSSGTSAFTVYSAVTASISGGTSPICYGTNPGILTATGSGGSGSYTYLWYKNGISTGLTTQTYDPGILYTTPNSFYCEVDGGLCGMANTPTTTITIETEPPIITCPVNINQTADAGVCNAAVSIVDPTATDNCSTNFIFTGVRSDALALSATYPVGVTTINWTATDEAGNVSLGCDQTITITDDEIPAITCSGNINQTADPGVCDAAITVPTPANSDNCGLASIVNDYNNSADASDTYPVGTTTVVWTVTDIHGNINNCSQIITITDNEVPSISCSADMTQTADLGVCNAAMTVITPATNDNCGIASILNNYNGTANASDTYPVGTTTVVWTVTDIHGNTNSCTQLITVTDDEIPAITCSGDMTQTADPGVCNAAITVITPATSDNCGVASVINNYNSTADATDTYPVGTTTVVWT